MRKVFLSKCSSNSIEERLRGARVLSQKDSRGSRGGRVPATIDALRKHRIYSELLIVPAVDHRFNWSGVPIYLVLASDFLTVARTYYNPRAPSRWETEVADVGANLGSRSLSMAITFVAIAAGACTRRTNWRGSRPNARDAADLDHPRAGGRPQ